MKSTCIGVIELIVLVNIVIPVKVWVIKSLALGVL